jgi:hypothetical protein
MNDYEDDQKTDLVFQEWCETAPKEEREKIRRIAEKWNVSQRLAWSEILHN